MDKTIDRNSPDPSPPKIRKLKFCIGKFNNRRKKNYPVKKKT